MPSDKLEADARRAKTRSFAGYLKDRLTGSADFEDAPARSKTEAKTLGSDNKANDEVRAAAGMKKGGRVPPKFMFPPKKASKASAAPDDDKAFAFKSGGMVRRGYGKARCA